MLVVSIAGISGSGKTTLINSLEKKLKKTVILSFDDYNFDE